MSIDKPEQDDLRKNPEQTDKTLNEKLGKDSKERQDAIKSGQATMIEATKQDIQINGGEKSAKLSERLDGIQSQYDQAIKAIPADATKEDREKATEIALEKFTESLGELRGEINGKFGKKEADATAEADRINRLKEKTGKELMEIAQQKQQEVAAKKRIELIQNNEYQEVAEKKPVPEKLEQNLKSI